jgi:hypothetical protein
VLATRNPARLVLAAFSTLIVVGTVLLRLPIAADGDHPGLLAALFMSTSASTVTGLATFDISALSLTGELVVLALIQIGGFGIMALGSILAIIASHRMSLRQRMLTTAELGSIDDRDLKSIMKRVAQITLSVESALAVVLFARFTIAYGEAPGRAAYSAVFHAVSAFNNAGISLNSDSLIPYAADWIVLLAMSTGFIVGGLGFPVIIDIARKVRGDKDLGFRRGHLNMNRWMLHTKLVVATTSVLLVLGPIVIAIAEWGNPDTLGEDAHRLVRGRYCANGRLLDDRHRRARRTDPGVHEHPDVRRGGTSVNERWHQSDHLRRARFRDLGGSPGTTRRQRLRPAPSARVDPPGHHRRLALRRPRDQHCADPHGGCGDITHPGAVRGGFSVRHGWTVHRHHRRPPTGLPGAARDRHAGRANRAGHVRDRPCTA